MKKLEKALPYLLLVSYLGLSHYKQPQISDSIIIIALVALSCYRLFISSKEVPDYHSEFVKVLQDQQREIKDLQTNLGMISLANKRQETKDNSVW